MNTEPLMYHALAEWWPLLSAPDEYADEAQMIANAARSCARRNVETMLELGSGGGNTASHLKGRFAITLVDRSSAMLDVSRRLNPECDHYEGDMRSVRLGRTYDAVLIHDAVGYMVCLGDLRAALETAHAHCAPGGCGIFVPDHTRENFRDGTEHGGRDDAGRALRYIAWTHPPDAAETTYTTDFALMLRDASGLRTVQETHRFGLFGEGEWLTLMQEVGFVPQVRTEAGMPFHHGPRRIFIGVRPEE